MRKIIFYFFLVLFVFGGCSSFEQDAKNIVSENNIISVQYTKQINFIGHWKDRGKREKLVTDAVRNYEFTHQDTRIKVMYPEDAYMTEKIDHVEERFILQTVKSSKPEWDIIRLNGKFFDVANHGDDMGWAKKYLVDFSKIEAFRNAILPELLSDEVKSNYGGIIPGPFIEGQYWSLWFNQKVADKIGIDIKQQGMTFDNFISYIRAINIYNKNNPEDYIIPLGEGSDWQTTRLIPMQLYVSLFENKSDLFVDGIHEGKLKKWHQVLEAMELLSEFELYSNEGWKPWSEVSADLMNEKVLFYVNGSWMYNIWNDLDAEKSLSCFPAELPAFKENVIYPVGYIVTWAVPKNAPNKEAAIDFLLSMTTPDIADSWVRYTKSPTGIKGNMTDVNFGVDQYELFSNYINGKYARTSYTSRSDNSFIFGLNNAYNDNYVGAVIRGKITADEAMTHIRAGLVYEEAISELVH